MQTFALKNQDKMTNFQIFPPESRIWIYQSNTPIAAAKTPLLEEEIQQFIRQWTAHNQALRAYGEVRDHRFLIFMVDESQAGASGCSIDKSVHFVQYLERTFDLNFFDRMTFTYQENGEIKAATREEFAALFAQGIIHENTLVFDNLVKSKGEFEKNWVKKLGESWHKRMV